MSASKTVIRAAAFKGEFTAFTDEQLVDMQTRLVYALGRTQLYKPEDIATHTAIRHKAEATLGRLHIEQRVREATAADEKFADVCGLRV